MNPSEESRSDTRSRDFRGLAVLAFLGVLEVAGIYLLLVVDSPISAVTRRMAETFAGRVLLAGSVVVLLSFGMAGLLTWVERSRKAGGHDQ